MWIFDKKGNRKEVSAPTNINGKPIKEKHVTVTGAIPAGVGFSMNLSGKKNNSFYFTEL